MLQGKIWMKIESLLSLLSAHRTFKPYSLNNKRAEETTLARCVWSTVWGCMRLTLDMTLRDITWQRLWTKGDQRYFSRCFVGVLWKRMHYSSLCLRRMPTRWQEVEEALQTRPAGGTARLAMWRHCALAGDNSLPQNLNGAEEHKSPERKNKGIHREVRWSSSAPIP